MGDAALVADFMAHVGITVKEGMHMSEMVERVAMAMLAAQEGTGDRFPCYEAMARAAIAAMREPTKSMQDEGFYKIPAYDVDPDDAQRIWQAMIDEALK